MGTAASNSSHNFTRFKSADNKDMPCEACRAEFNPFTRRKKQCCECGLFFCSSCLIRDVGQRPRCVECNKLIENKNLGRTDLLEFRVRSLKQFLINRHIQTKNCKEKYDLIDLILLHYGGLKYQAQQAEQRQHTEYLLDRRRVVESTGSAAPPAAPQPQPAAPQPQPPSSSTTGPTPTERNRIDPEQAGHIPSEQSFTASNTGANPRNPPAYDDIFGPGPGVFGDINTTSRAREADIPADVEMRSVTPDTVDNVKRRNSEGGGDREEAPGPAPDSVRPDAMTNSTNVPSSSEGPTNLNPKHIHDILVRADIAKLPVRKLKELLQRYATDYSMIWEKSELIAKVELLWDQCQANLQTEIPDDPSAEGLCKICMDAHVDCVLLNCGHMICCTPCGRLLAECPICRSLVVKIVHVFKS